MTFLMVATEVLTRDVLEALNLLAWRTSRVNMPKRLQRMLMRRGARKHNNSNSTDMAHIIER